MSDTSELIEELNMWIEQGTMPTMTTQKTLSLLDEIKRLQNRWIPVSERLPEVGEFVLVFIGEVPFQNEPINIIERTAYDGGRFVDFMCEYATHWMPLPPPPEDK